MKFLAYAVAWFIVLSQWNDLRDYYDNPVTHAPLSAIIITALVTIILTVATFKELTKGKNKIIRLCWHREP